MTAPALPRVPLRHSVRVVARQHRLAVRLTGGLALAAVIGLVAVALWSSHLTDAFEAGPCSVEGDPGRDCYRPVREHLDTMLGLSRVFDVTGTALIALPVVLGAFVAGPMIARELESGTYRLSWTQSVSPSRWLTAKLAVPAVLALSGVTVLTAVLARARSGTHAVYPANWYEPGVFAASGVVPLAYTAFGLCTGALAGLLVRRTVPALTAATLVTAAVVAALVELRGSLWPLRTRAGTPQEISALYDDSWIIDSGRTTADGARVSFDTCWQPVSEHPACLAGRTVTGNWASHHPASHFWPLQLVETGILLALSALALALAFRVLRRSHG
ncbi:hypothetical protein ABZ371_18965 [Streptomyces sp. NPDC005899]|uniref:hypothetical protein n=1 Tax=Streptomyces sp. NPDC005899 TaxID=3155716 RepID=UPI0033EBA72C